VNAHLQEFLTAFAEITLHIASNFLSENVIFDVELGGITPITSLGLILYRKERR
jgi:hypothetical protein